MLLKTLKKQKVYKQADPCVDKVNKLIVLTEEHLFIDIRIKINKEKLNIFDINYKDVMSEIRNKYRRYHKLFGYGMIIIIKNKKRLLIFN